MNKVALLASLLASTKKIVLLTGTDAEQTDEQNCLLDA